MGDSVTKTHTNTPRKDAHGCCGGKPASLVYEPCEAGLGWQAAATNNVACLRLHGKRAFASVELTESVASASEVAHLKSVAPRLKSGGCAVNISVWRRSCLMLLVVSSATTTVFRATDLVRELGHTNDMQAKAEGSSRRLLNGTDPALAAVSFRRTEYYLERPKIVGGPGCNECTPSVAASTGCQRYLFGQCSWQSVEDAERHCSSWAQCGGFVCQNARNDCQARGKGKDSDIALTRSGFSLARTHDWGIDNDLADEEMLTNSRVQAQADVEAWYAGDTSVSFVCPERSTDPTCDLGATTWLKTPDYHIENFGNYTKRFGMVVLARLALQPLWASCLLQGTVLLLALCGFVSINLALLHWDRYDKSRRFLLLGWLLVFMGPALVSIVPLRIFVDWSAASEALLDYTEMFKQHFNIDAAEAAITAACDAAAGDGSASSDGRGLLTSAIDEVCGTIDDQLPRNLRIHHEFSATVGCWIVSGTISKTLVDRTYDFAPAHEACDQAREIKASEDDQNALEKVQEACAVFMEVSSAQPGGNAGRLLEQAQSFADKVQTTVELMLGTAHALRAFKMLLPAALSIGPGLLRGSVKMKTFIPQSSIPGMFITLLPWLYTPLVWTLYNIGFQLVGDPFMLAGLLFLAFGPMIYYVIGVAMKVTLPMSEEKIRQWLCLTSIQGKIVSLLAYLALGYWILFVEGSSNRVLETMNTMKIADISLVALLGIVSNTITSFVLTTLAATDFMVGEIANQRELENVLEGEGGAQTKMKVMRALVRPTRLKCFGVKCCRCGDKSGDEVVQQELTSLKDVLESRNGVLDEMRDVLRSSADKGKTLPRSVPEQPVNASFRKQSPQEQKVSRCSTDYRKIPVGAVATTTNAPDESNAHSMDDTSRVKLLKDYLRYLPVHFSRAMESAKLLDNVTSVAEERHLAATVGLRKGRTANLIVWRRSALVATVTLSIVAVGWAIASLISNYSDLSDLRELSLSTSQRLVNGKDPADIEWKYETEPGLSTASVIIGGPACEFAPGLAGQCSWPRAEAATHCSAWAKCGAYVCSASDDGSGLCQARGHTTVGPAADTAGDGAALETHVKQDVVVEENFKDYSTRVFQVGLARLRIGSAVAAWWAEAIVVGCVVMSLVMSIRALHLWDHYYKSRSYVAVAWLLTFMGPCLVSLLPLRLFIDAGGLAGAMQDWVVETRLEYSIEEQLISSLKLCESIVDGDYDDEYNESTERLESAIDGVCAAVDNFVPQVIDWQYHESINIPCVINAQIDIDEYHDFRPVHESCARARAAIENDNAAGALSEVKSSCLDYIDLVGSSGNAFEIMAMVEEYVDKATSAGEVIFSFVQAIASFRILVPAAIAVAPAVIRGALKVKIIVPQSSIPGMFICMLPWVYCPLVWCFTSMLFQLVGSVPLLVGLILIAYSPMVYFVVGRWKRITMPMSNAVVVNVLRWIEGYHMFLSVLAYVMAIYGLVRTDIGALSSLFEDWDMQLFGRWPVLVSIVFSAAAKLILTGLAGFDYIISTIVEQRRCELPRGSIYAGKEMTGDLFETREERLDDVLALFPNDLLDERP